MLHNRQIFIFKHQNYISEHTFKKIKYHFENHIEIFTSRRDLFMYVGSNSGKNEFHVPSLNLFFTISFILPKI